MADTPSEGSVKKETLRKREILRGYGAVQEVLEKGRKFSGKFVNVFYLPDREKRVAFIAARRYRKAVQRNRIKRLLRENYRKNKELFPNGKWILYGKFFEPLPSYHDIRQDLIETVNRVRVEINQNDQ